MSDQSWNNRGQGGGGWGGAGGAGQQGWAGGQQQGWPGGQQQGGSGPQQSWGGGDLGWNIGDDCRDREPCDRLRLVRFKVLFLKRNLEVAFPEEEELVPEDMPKEGIISWKIAEFVQKMRNGQVAQPPKWRGANYPPPKEDDGSARAQGGNVLELPDQDKRFLRVFCQVLDVYDREKMNYERQQVDVLGEIRDELRKLRGGNGG